MRDALGLRVANHIDSSFKKYTRNRLVSIKLTKEIWAMSANSVWKTRCTRWNVLEAEIFQPRPGWLQTSHYDIFISRTPTKKDERKIEVILWWINIVVGQSNDASQPVSPTWKEQAYFTTIMSALIILVTFSAFTECM